MNGGVVTWGEAMILAGGALLVIGGLWMLFR